MNKDGYSSIFRNSYKLETIWMFINSWTNKYKCDVYIMEYYVVTK